MNKDLTRADILNCLYETSPAMLEQLYQLANEVRERYVGKSVHLRGLIEISNNCIRECAYCGLSSKNSSLTRYRMSEEEIIGCAKRASSLGYGTVVLQAGEDYGIKRAWLVNIVKQIKSTTKLAVTLSLGERPERDLIAWKQAGADRYLLRFETSDRNLYRLIHPTHKNRTSDRIAILKRLREIGYEIGSGIMVGIPGQTFSSIANDIELFKELDLDMIGIGPFIPHPLTPLGSRAWLHSVSADEQVPNTEEMVYKVVALTRILCPESNIPSTTALATINKTHGRQNGLKRGCNVVMPNLTPLSYRALYEIYPSKACVNETAEQCNLCLHSQIRAIGREIGTGSGGRSDMRMVSM
jgi:biotin synthase